MAFTDSFPNAAAGINDSNGASNSNCGTQAAKMLTDNSDAGNIVSISERRWWYRSKYLLCTKPP